jgi:ATP-dependent helicase/nuclease subunit A
VTARRIADDLRARDAEARAAAQREFEHPLLIEAGAGTGKTTTLVARIVAWCLGPGWARAEERDPDRSAGEVAAQVLGRVVAITFTEAAAAQMASRVGEALAEIERGAEPEGIDREILSAVPDREQRARALLGTLDHLVVRTIHAFCRRLLAAYPLEARLHPAFQVDADGSLQAQVVREALEAKLSQAYAQQGDGAYLTLAGQGVGPPEIEAALLALVERGAPASALATDPFAPPRVRAALAELRESAERLLETAEGRLEPVGRKTAQVALALVQTLQATGVAVANVEDLSRLAERLRKIWDDTRVERLSKWAASKFNDSEKASLGDRAPELAQRARRVLPALQSLRALRPRLTELARRVLRPLLEEVRGELRARGVVSFVDLLHDARDLLEHEPDVAARVRRDIDQLLVDEFQDTDHVQCRLIEILALEGAPGERPGLFVVGDPKQSIYGWRSADLAAYQALREKLEAQDGVVHTLAVNFRSVPEILAEVERVVRPVMIAVEGVQPPFEPLIASRAVLEASGPDGGNPAVEYWISWARDASGAVVPGTRALEAAELEARALARDLRRQHDERGVAWRDFGVLLRSRGDLDIYLTALREADVPYAVQGDRSYYQRREIIEAAALVRCVLDPNDHVSLLTSLRSPAVGVPDAALIPLWARNLPARLTKLQAPAPELLKELAAELADVAGSLPQEVPALERVAGWERSLLRFVEVLATLRQSFRTDPADVFVERLRSELLFEVSEAARYQGHYRLANLDLFLRGLIAELSEAEGGSQAVLRHLRARISEAYEREEGRPKEACDDAVQILTIHQAKGLDFEHVYLVQLHKSHGGGRPGSLVEPFEGGWEYRLLDGPTLGLPAAAKQRERVARAELVRTLYVAITRAKRRLVLAGTWAEDGATSRPLEDAAAHVELLRRRESAPALEPMLARLDGTGRAFEDARETRWLFPALLPEDAATQAEETGRFALADAERIRADSERLGERCAEAAAHMARSFRSAASAEAHRELRELLAARETEDRVAPHAATGAPSERVATAVGSADHQVLETLDLDAPPGKQIETARLRLRRALEGLLPEPERAAALAHAEESFERFARGPLFEKLRSLRRSVVARELPLLSPPGPDPDAPAGFVVGAIDLLYRDPETGEFVVADFKTDRVRGEELRARADAYASQGAAYTRAVREALDLEAPPRFELWFLHAGRIEVRA